SSSRRHTRCLSDWSSDVCSSDLFELGKKHTGAFTEDGVTQLIEQGRRWLDAGALQLVVEARESAKEVGLFDDKGNLHCGYADRFAKAFGLDTVMFEAPNKASQFALLKDRKSVV